MPLEINKNKLIQKIESNQITISEAKIDESMLPIDKKLLIGELSYRPNDNSLKLPPKSIKNQQKNPNHSFLRQSTLNAQDKKDNSPQGNGSSKNPFDSVE